MCGRFAAGHLTQRQMLEILERFLCATWSERTNVPPHKTGYQISPIDQVQVAYLSGGQGIASTARWADGISFCAKIERDTVWHQNWQHGRCVMPMLGYYEWAEILKGSGEEVPHYITVETNAPMSFFAGFLSRDKGGVSILTREPAQQIAHIHHRMPVIVPETDIGSWLSGEMGVAEAQANLGAGWNGRFSFHTVKPLKKCANGVDLIEPHTYTNVQTSFDF